MSNNRETEEQTTQRKDRKSGCLTELGHSALILFAVAGFFFVEQLDRDHELREACRCPGNIRSVKFWVNMGADVNAAEKTQKTKRGDGWDRWGGAGETRETPLEIASGTANNLETVKYLVSRGAYVKTTTGALIRASGTVNNLETVKYLVSQGSYVTTIALMRACRTANNLETVKYLLSRGADIKAKGENGQTALMWACGTANNLETVKYLVSQGADIKAKDLGGGTVLMYACRICDNLETVKYLVSQCVDINAKDNDGKTALMLASGEALMFLRYSLSWGRTHRNSYNIETVKYLVSQGADVNATDRDGKTALDRAKGVDVVYNYLLSRGAQCGRPVEPSPGEQRGRREKSFYLGPDGKIDPRDTSPFQLLRPPERSKR